MEEVRRTGYKHTKSLWLFIVALFFLIIVLIVSFINISRASYTLTYAASPSYKIKETFTFSGVECTEKSITLNFEDNKKTENVKKYDYKVKKGVLYIDNRIVGVCNAFVITTIDNHTYICKSTITAVIILSLITLFFIIMGFLMIRKENGTAYKLRIAQLEREVAELIASREDDA